MLFILNRQEKVVGVLKNSGKNSVPFFNDLLTEDLATGSETLEFTTVSRNGIGQHLVVGNFIAFKKGKSYKLFQIMQTEEDHQDELYISVYAECAGLQLINSAFRGAKIISASFDRIIKTLLSDTSWNVGALPYGLATTYDLDIEQASVYSLLQTYAQKYGVELEFRVEINRGKISKKYVDGYYSRGKVTGKRFTYERDIEGIVRKTDATELYTALIGKGNNGISFKDVTVDGIDKPMGQDFVANQSAYEKYNNNGYHIVGIYECDTDDAKDLLRKTHKRLLEVSEPKVEYDISVLLLCELLGEKWNEVAIGDTISVFDNAFYPPIMVSARVSKLQTSMTDKNANKCTLANFIEVKSNITSEMRKIASQLQGYVDNRFPIGSSDIQDGAVGMDKISDIYTQTITTDILKAGKVETEKLIAQEAEITDAKIENAVIESLKVTNAEIEKLKVKDAEIDYILAGNITADNIQAGTITAGSGIIADGAIGSAQISSIDAGKISTGTVDTSKVNISGVNGNLLIRGNRLQVFEGHGNNRIERVSLGDVDNNGEVYGLRVRGKDGQTILYDENGVYNEGITDGAITNEKISGETKIDGYKLDINSVIREVNNSTETISGTKIDIDGTNLLTELSKITIIQDEHLEKIDSNTSKILANEQNIALKVDSQTYQQDKDGLKKSIQKNTSAIEVLDNNIDLRVSENIAKVNIGANNYILNSGEFENTKYWLGDITLDDGEICVQGDVINTTEVEIEPNKTYIYSATIKLPEDFVVNETNLLNYIILGGENGQYNS